ncbi:MAG: MarR family transcriptional regulator [Bacteroidales bacterium]|nr:MarR family transcriptional regulator [Bacteroidales bacterium]
MEVKIFNKALDVSLVSTTELKQKNLPPDVWIFFNVARSEYNGQSLLLLQQSVQQNFTPKQLRYLSDRIGLMMGEVAVFVFDDIPYYLRMRLAEKNVFFIVSNKYAYLPSIIINSKSVGSKQYKALTSTAQYLLLYHLQKENLTHLTASEIAAATHLQYTTVTRAIKVLLGLKLCEIEIDDQRFKHLVFPESKEQLFARSQSFLINPVQSVWYCDEIKNTQGLWLAGVSALSKFTMINSDELITYALETKSFNRGKDNENFKNLNPIEGQYKIECWKYHPIESDMQTVDKISLALSLKETDDPRIEKEVETMMKKLW